MEQIRERGDFAGGVPGNRKLHILGWNALTVVTHGEQGLPPALKRD
jgi:hypothetical protein